MTEQVPVSDTEPALLWRRLLAETLGTALLVAGVIGSGIMAQTLSPNDIGLELLENSLATGGVLFILIATLGPVSGAHFNPVVTLVDTWIGNCRPRDIVPYISGQVVGAFLGALLANVMFGLSAVSISAHHRGGTGRLLSEVVATFGLLLVIFGLGRSGRADWIPAAVSAFIVGAYWFTASTSFANPAVAFGRMFSNTFAGIAPASVPAFVLMELIGGALAAAAVWALWPVE